MDFRYPPEAEEFRASVRAWLEANLPADLRGVTVRDDLTPALVKRLRAWNRTLADAGYAGMSWPEEYGGRAASVIEQVVLAEEMSRAEAPGPINVIGLSNIAPAIMTYGTAAQKERLLLPMLRGDEIWCQGFSEPNAGSDLASITTSARRDGDDFVVNGQKIWTSGAHNADWCFMLARTDPDAPKHRGITYLLLDMKSPGITVRPLVNMADQHHFNEVFFEDVRVPAANAVGEVNRGWYIGTTTLDFERSSIGSAVGQRQNVERNIRWLKENKASIAPTDYDAARLQWADRWVEVQTATLLSYRIISMQASGKIPNSEASIAKGFNTELTQRISRTALKMMGMMGQVTDRKAPMKGNVAVGYLGSVSATIAGGTSEIQRNIIATRGLGLPRA